MAETFQERHARQVAIKARYDAGDTGALWELVSDAFALMARSTTCKLRKVGWVEDFGDAEQELRMTLYHAATKWVPSRASWLTCAGQFRHLFWSRFHEHRGPVAYSAGRYNRKQPIPRYDQDTDEDPGMLERAVGHVDPDGCPGSELRRIAAKARLSEREAEVLRRRYEDEEDGRSTSLAFGVSRQRVDELHKVAIGKLRHVADRGWSRG